MIAVSGLLGCFGFGFRMLCLDLLDSGCLFAVGLWLRFCWVFWFVEHVLCIMMLVCLISFCCDVGDFVAACLCMLAVCYLVVD